MKMRYKDFYIQIMSGRVPHEFKLDDTFVYSHVRAKEKGDNVSAPIRHRNVNDNKKIIHNYA